MGLLMGLLLGCSPLPDDAPARLRIAVLPDQTPVLLRQQHDPLVAYLGRSLGIPTELILPGDYAELTSLFRSNKVDLAFFGGLTFVQARRQGGAVPLVMRDIDLRLTTVFLANASSTGKTLEDFRGARLAFGSRLSTSGHLMPRYYLEKRGIVPESFFYEVRYSGSHDKTVDWVWRRQVDLGAANTAIVEQMYAKGIFRRGDLRIIWTTPPYPDYVWAAHPSLSASFQRRLRDAFLALSPQNPEHARVLASQSAGRFLPVKGDEFDSLTQAAAALGMLGDP
jgi:phosphonate transport system substrate-binding protein